LFSSAERTAEPIRQVLAGLGVVGEHCSEVLTAVERVSHQNYQIVIIDWDKQPEAGLLLTTARERKAAERPLTLAIVSDDVSVPKALQAGANSTLRKPLQVNQVKDTLATARDLLRAKQESAASVAHAAAAGASVSSSAAPTNRAQEEEKPRGEFLQPSAKSHAPEFVSTLEPVVPEKDSKPVLAPVASVVSKAAEKPVPPPPAPASAPQPDKPKGLEWYLKTRAGASASSVSGPPQAPPTPIPAPTPAKPDLLGYDQPTPRSSPSMKPKLDPPEPKPSPPSTQERKKEAELFDYMAGGTSKSEEVSPPKSRLGKAAILGALALASCAIVAAPQAPWHSQMRGIWARGRQTMHGWLNPQPVAPPQAPAAHEDFGRAGDEYKLPASETIPDATTDPSQIQVLPVVDPTAKKPNNDGTNPQPVGLPDVTGLIPSGTTPNPEVQVQEKPTAPSIGMAQPAAGPAVTAAPAPSSSAVAPPVSAPPHADSPAAIPPSLTSNVSSVPAQPTPVQPAPPKNRPPHHATVARNVPSSLKSQLASMTPDASGNRAPETALPSIEPVSVSEAAERALLTDQPAIAYPPNAKGQATVVLQVLVGRDGTVQDAKFLQGSLAFARTAIDGVKLWKFKPYTMNGRVVSVQALLTLSFKPSQQ
jgi:periplasmic protein TonB